jgi:hypothetical protein
MELQALKDAMRLGRGEGLVKAIIVVRGIIHAIDIGDEGVEQRATSTSSQRL